MNFHTLGNENNKVIFLIHGMMTPWQIWEDAAEYFRRDYFVVIPELDAHTEDEPTRFCSVEDEAEKIKEYALEHFGGNIYAICGLSMGGRIAAEVAGMQDITVSCLVLDGAPLMGLPRILISLLKKSYVGIIAKSKNRDPKTLENCRKNFLPDRYMENYLKVADNMDVESIAGILDSVFSTYEFRPFDPGMRILYMHGTKGAEPFVHKAAVKMKEMNPQTEIKCYEGYAHAQLACFEIEKWTADVARFVK